MVKINMDMIQTIGLAVILLLIGMKLRKKIQFFEKYCIPAPVIGGFLFSIIVFIFRQTNVAQIKFDDTLQKFFMIMFFTSVGFNASLKVLKKGGKKVVMFLFVAAGLCVMQNVVAVVLSKFVGIPPLLALMTGSTPMTGGHGTSAAVAPTIEALGQAARVTVDKDSTVIVEGAGNPEAISHRVAVIKSQIETTTSEFDREKLQERLAKLSGGVAVIKVGAATETELKEMKLRIEDALNATRAAVEEGIVAGGGTALANVIPAVADLELTGDEATGRNIVLRALEEPVRQIAHNAGFEGSIVIDRLKNAEVGTGFNAATGEWVNMIEEGIIDPVKVSRSALQNAASVASLILTTEAVVANKPEPVAPAPAMDPSMMGGMM